MFNHKLSTKHKNTLERAQALVEFAIALPVLMMMLVGIFEAARMVFTYAAVNTAAREASRYASAVGLNDGGTVTKYNDCAGILQAAQDAAFFTTFSVFELTHDTGPGSGSTNYCPDLTVPDDISLDSGDRINVRVVATYSPMVRLIPFPTRDFESTSARTILGILELDAPTNTPGGGGGGGGGGATSTATATVPPGTTVVVDTATATITSTPGEFSTLTPPVTPTITLLPSITPTFTETFTPTITFTPTSTSTPVLGCGSLSASELSLNGNLLTMTITNPHDTIELASIQLVWNAVNGGPNGKPLVWQTATVAGQTWTVANNSGSYTSAPGSTVTIPGNNQTSYIIIAFDKSYQNAPINGTSVTLNFATIDCTSITRTR